MISSLISVAVWKDGADMFPRSRKDFLQSLQHICANSGDLEKGREFGQKGALLAYSVHADFVIHTILKAYFGQPLSHTTKYIQFI